MPKESKILKGQTLADMAIQECGMLEGLKALANNISVGMTEDMASGTILTIFDVDIFTNIHRLIVREGVKPACKFSPYVEDESQPPVLGGIGYMAIGIDFIVS